MSQDYLYFYLASPFGQQLVAQHDNGSAQPNLSVRALSNYPLLLPPLREQRAIASLLGALDDKIELNRQMNETLEATARLFFKDWFVDFGPTRAKAEGRARRDGARSGQPRKPLNVASDLPWPVAEAGAGAEGKPYLAPELWDLFPDAMDDEDKPVGWAGGVLGDFTEIQNGYAFKSSDWRERGVPVVKIGSVKASVVDLENVSFVSESIARERQAFRLDIGDVLVGLTGYVGETGRVPPTENLPLLNQRVGRFRPLSVANDLSPYVYMCVRDPLFKEYAEAKAHGSAQPNVSVADLLTYPVVNPGLQLMDLFGSLNKPLLDQILENLGESRTLAKTRDLLLPKLMSGEIRLRDAEKLVAEAL